MGVRKCLSGFLVVGENKANQTEIRFCLRYIGVEEGVPHLEAWVRVGRGIPHVKGHNSVLRLRYSKE
jgi:hypothetical protein